jgi:hypothetical protein
VEQVLVHQGSYRNFTINNEAFDLVKDYKEGKRGGFVTVRSNGRFGPEHDVVRIRVSGPDDIEKGVFDTQVGSKDTIAHESDEEVMERIRQRFNILDNMTRATINGDVRAMIVSGPPGVGKSYGIEKQLEMAGLFDTISQKEQKYEFVKGAMTPIGLYCKLFERRESNNVIVFDDCDSVLLDDLSLNILKAALDTGKTRRIHWNADSHKLRSEDVPNTFEFRGSVIFVTNLKFENVRSKKLADHLEALQSRCHYLDLTLDTMRDKILRIRQIFREGDLFKGYDFSTEQGEEVIDFMQDNKNRLREVSLRMALKIADLTKISDDWQMLARNTCMVK